jgi:hypothetical protein
VIVRNFSFSRSASVISLLGGLLFTACSPAPRHLLSVAEKKADLVWLFSQIDQNYAPLQYKESKYKFTFETLKPKYLAEAETTPTNESFYRLMNRLVAEFHDGHMSTTLLSSNLPNRTNVAYLGFDGVRSGNNLLVQKLLPTITEESKYPLKVGDQIVKLDGKTLPEIIKSDFVPYRNVGQDESNLTIQMPKIFNRYSLAHEMPTTRDANLTVLRGGTEISIRLPWVIKDLYKFTSEQKEAASGATTVSTVGALTADEFFKLGVDLISGKNTMVPKLVNLISRTAPGFNFKNSFLYFDETPTWNDRLLSKIVAEGLKKTEPTLAEFKRERTMPPGALLIDPAATYPTYLWAEKILDKDKKPTGQVKLLSYMYLNTFSPDGEEDDILKEVGKTLKTLQTFGVKGLIVDMINNGGGSLSLGLRLAQVFSNHRIALPNLQFKVSDTWLDEFEKKSITNDSDSEKEIARRVYESLAKEQSQKIPLSQKWDIESLFPFAFEPNTDLTEDFQTVLLVNEMCASMCDIFSGVMKDNKLATLVGSKTMGAGGNVVVHREAPNSHLMVNTTESLMLRRDDSYVENNGVDPDVALNVSESVATKYDEVKKRAVVYLMDQKI